MKIFVSQLFHEASSFVPNKVNVSSFKKRHYLKGYDVKTRFENDKDWVSGALKPFIDNGDDINIGVCTACNPAGVIEEDSFREILNDMLKEYQDYLVLNGPPDVLMLLLHGANLVESVMDPDAYLINKFKECAGHLNSTVIGVTLDFHANISEKLVKSADIVVVGIEYPHVDTYERGVFASNLSRSKAESKKDLNTHRFPIPLLTCLPRQATVDDLPFHRLTKFAEKIKKKFELTDLCVSGGFAFGDCYDVGMNLIAINDNYDDCVKAYREVMSFVWDLKEELLEEVPGLEDVWKVVEQKAKLGRVVVADVSDSPGSGGNGDETHLLHRLINSPNKFVSAFHVDPSVVQEAEQVAIGTVKDFQFGTSLSHPDSKVLKVKAKVLKLLNYQYSNIGPMMHGATLNGGPTALLQVENGLIIVTTERIQAYDINAFLNIGIDITKQQCVIIAIKSTAHFRASYTDLADQGIELIRAPGWSDIDFRAYNYHHRRKPILPLEKIEKKEWDDIMESYCV